MSARWEAPELLQPITADQPCGENLEDTQLLAAFDAFRLFGQSEPNDPPPEWGDIKNSALDALGRSKDLRLLAHLGTALLRTDGIPAFFETLKIASGWLNTYWSQTYPLIDEDAILRRNALNCFADPVAVVDGLRRMPLVSSREHGRFSLRDLDIAAGLLAPGETDSKPDQAHINAAFAILPLEELEQLQQDVAGAVATLASIDARMRKEDGPEAAPSFDPLSAQLVKMDRALRAQLALRPGAEGAGTDGADPAAGGQGTKEWSGGAVNSRQHAIHALDAVADFFRKTEPSSPIPLLLERAKRLVSKDFLDVLAEMAPEALGSARMAVGLRQQGE